MQSASADIAAWREMKDRARRWMELVVLFVGVPLAMAFAMKPSEFRWALIGLAVVGIGLLLITRAFRWRSLFQGKVFAHWRLILVFTIGSAAVIAAAVLVVEQARGYGGLLFHLPLERPQLMAMITLLYPIILVTPQELIFRPLFFKRYGDLFPSVWAAIIVNSFLFGLAHLFYWNWPAVVLTTMGNVFFAYAYVRLESFPLAWVLHAIGGILIFAIGLGPFFYHGNI